MQSSKIAHAIRDAVYLASAPNRQVNPFDVGSCISHETSLDQLNKADASRTFVGLRKDKIVVTKDRLLFLKHTGGCCAKKREWVEVFHENVNSVEINSPAQWPTWYAVMWYFPPWGLFGCHRQILGAPRCGFGMWLYRLTLGGFGLLYIADAFIMCLCIDCLRLRSEIRITAKGGSDLDLSIQIDKHADGKRFREALNTELSRHPLRSRSQQKLQSHHVQMRCPFECCKKREEFTERDTTIDSLSMSVHRVHKDKPKKAVIPPSLCW